MNVTLVIPVLNEAAQIRAHLLKIFAELDALPNYQFSMLVVDDGSTDTTREVLQALVAEEPRLHLLGLSRNFGKEAAILAGLTAASESDAVVVMDSDLQHPPSLLAGMLALWRQGIPVVEAVKTHRGCESWLGMGAARGFYWLFARLSGLQIQGHTDFKLLDRQVVQQYIALPERDRFFRGLVSWLGFPSAQVPFEVPPREQGGSRWTRWRLWRYALNAITAFSARPLQIITLLGALTLLLSLVVGIKALLDHLRGMALEGFTTVILLQLFIGGALMISLGLLGIYVARLHDEVKARPSFVIGWQYPKKRPHDGESHEP